MTILSVLRYTGSVLTSLERALSLGLLLAAPLDLALSDIFYPLSAHSVQRSVYTGENIWGRHEKETAY